MKCDFYSGCKCEATWRVLHLWGERIVRYSCDKHKPGQRMAKTLPNFYECTPLQPACGACGRAVCDGHCECERWDTREQATGPGA